jgi:hypothetical protein
MRTLKKKPQNRFTTIKPNPVNPKRKDLNNALFFIMKLVNAFTLTDLIQTDALTFPVEITRQYYFCVLREDSSPLQSS